MRRTQLKPSKGRCSRALPTLGGRLIQLQAPGKCASSLACSVRGLGLRYSVFGGKKNVFPEFWLRSLLWRMELHKGKYQKSLVYNLLESWRAKGRGAGTHGLPTGLILASRE